MFDHIGIHVSNARQSIPFYENALAPLGLAIVERQPELDAVIFSGPSKETFLWMGPAAGDYYGTPLSPTIQRPIHLAFSAPSKHAVDEFYANGLKYGGSGNGAPADCGNGYYAAFLLDPDGNNIEAGIKT